MTSVDKDCGQLEGRREPPAAQPDNDGTSDRNRLSDSIVGLFDRLREAAEAHDGD